MRPLVVLLLVLGALGALFFALTSIGGRARGGPDARGVNPAPPPVVTEPRADLVAPSAAEPPVVAAPADTETRQAAQPVDGTPQGRPVAFGAIEGLVVDKFQRPIAEAKVSLLNARPTSLGDDYYALRGEDPPKPLVTVTTDASGAFRFDKLDPRKDWSFVVTHERYLSYMPELPIPVPEGGVWEERVRLDEGQTCQGFVRDARTGQPIAGASLVVEGAFALQSRKKSPNRLEAVSDETGAYVFTNVGASFGQGRVLTVSAPGYATQVHSNFMLAALGEPPAKFKNRQGEAELVGRQQDFELEPGKVIAGRVFDPERRGVAGIEIEALGQSGNIGCTGLAKSGPRGEFLIEGLAEGLYTVRVSAAQYDAAPLQRVEAGDTNVEIELFEQSAVTGRVIDEGGQPLSSFTVKARMANEISKAFGAVAAQRQVKSASDGRFELKGVPEGSYVIEAVAPGYPSCFSDTFTTTQGLVTSDVLVRMTRGGSLSGRVVNAYDGAPVAGAEVATLDNDYIDGQIWELFGALEPTATTKTKVYCDADGRFEIPVMTPGTYQVQVSGRGYSQVAVKDVVVAEGQNTDLPQVTLQKGAVIRGVVYGSDRTPQAGASVQLSPGQFAFEGYRTVRTDGSGRYLIENARPGTYHLSATRPASGAGNPFEAIADQKHSQVEITIDDGKEYEVDLQFGS